MNYTLEDVQGAIDALFKKTWEVEDRIARDTRLLNDIKRNRDILMEVAERMRTFTSSMEFVQGLDG